MMTEEAEREQRAHELARLLFFTLEKHGATFTLTRDVDVPERVHHANLTLAEVEDLLTTWGLRGPHGG